MPFFAAAVQNAANGGVHHTVSVSPAWSAFWLGVLAGGFVMIFYFVFLSGERQ